MCCSKLRVLRLCNANVGDDGAIGIVNSLLHGNVPIEDLSLRANCIGDDGAAAIVPLLDTVLAPEVVPSIMYNKPDPYETSRSISPAALIDNTMRSERTDSEMNTNARLQTASHLQGIHRMGGPLEEALGWSSSFLEDIFSRKLLRRLRCSLSRHRAMDEFGDHLKQ